MGTPPTLCPSLPLSTTLPWSLPWSPLVFTSPSSTTLPSRLPWVTRPSLWLRRLRRCLLLLFTHTPSPSTNPVVSQIAPVVSHITKREAEAEADPALIYTTAVHHSPLVSPLVSTAVHQPIVYNSPVQTPLVYNSAVQTPVVYNAVQTPLLKTVDNAVVPTFGGYVHSSHVGVCTNNQGVRVPC